MKTKKFWITLSLEILAAIAIFMGLTYWQQRDMLASNTAVPIFESQTLKGETIRVPELGQSKKTLLYFFAPWCNVCHFSISNLNILRGQMNESELDIVIVALDWSTEEEVKTFLKDHDLDYPVILGDAKWQEAYKIKGFPTYYVIDDKGEITAKSLGYSSSVGMLSRTLFKG